MLTGWLSPHASVTVCSGGGGGGLSPRVSVTVCSGRGVVKPLYQFDCVLGGFTQCLTVESNEVQPVCQNMVKCDIQVFSVVEIINLVSPFLL